jgi:hypothetical protein
MLRHFTPADLETFMAMYADPEKGEWVDEVEYGILADEWRRRPNAISSD